MSQMTPELPLFHGGNIELAIKATGIPLARWIDLSTGISPYSYPTDTIPGSAFTKLPYLDDAFKNSVSTYYGSEQFLALPGTQIAIQRLPSLLPKLPVLLPTIGYQEHAQAWKKNGNVIAYYDSISDTQARKNIESSIKNKPSQHLVIINPNNPTTLCFPVSQLIQWAQQLNENAYLIIDEAFIDTTSDDGPNASMIGQLSRNKLNNVIILRSFGKFFGLAGVRLGFLFASQQILKRVDTAIPLWSINGPAQCLAQQALNDQPWLSKHHARISHSKQASIELFNPLNEMPECAACFHESLFSSYLFSSKTALRIYNHFHQNGILLRLINVSEEYSFVRVGRVNLEDTASINRIRGVLSTLILPPTTTPQLAS